MNEQLKNEDLESKLTESLQEEPEETAIEVKTGIKAGDDPIINQ